MTDPRSNLTIRRATERDLPGVLALYAQPSLDDGVTLSLARALEIFRRFASYPDYTLYVAEDTNGIVGTFALLVMDNLAHQGAPSGVVEDVAVAPAHQGHGIGKVMMDFARHQCRERGCYKLTLSSNVKREAAHRFYESLGFARHGYSFLVAL